MQLTIRKRSALIRILLGILNRLQDFLLNSNNANIDSNGELRFVTEYINTLASGNKYIFFDIGANRGDYTDLLIRLSDKNHLDYTVHMFEPVDYSFQSIKKNISLTNHIVLNKLGVSDKTESVDIFYNKAGSPLASLYERDVKEYNIVLDQKEKINLVRLYDYINQHQIQHIHLLKIDVEGHEIAAFTGLSNYLDSDFIDVIQFEYGGANIDSKTYLKDFFRLLELKGFTLYKIQKSCLNKVSYSTTLENFKHSNYIALSDKIV